MVLRSLSLVMLQGYPSAVAAMAVQYGFNEAVPGHAIFNTWQRHGRSRWRRTLLRRADLVGGIAIQLGKSFDIAFRMAGGNASGSARGIAIGTTPRDALCRAALRRQPKYIGVFLLEAQLGPSAVHPQGEGVLATRCHLAGPQGASSAIGIAHHDLRMVVQYAVEHESVEFRRDLAGLLAGYVSRQLIRVYADIAQGAYWPGHVRILAPTTLACQGCGIGPPVLRVLHLDQT